MLFMVGDENKVRCSKSDVPPLFKSVPHNTWCHIRPCKYGKEHPEHPVEVIAAHHCPEQTWPLQKSEFRVIARV